MGQATESLYACIFVVSEDVVDTATLPSAFSSPNSERLDALCLAIW
jgi:hypothetical protein